MNARLVGATFLLLTSAMLWELFAETPDIHNASGDDIYWYLWIYSYLAAFLAIFFEGEDKLFCFLPRQSGRSSETVIRSVIIPSILVSFFFMSQPGYSWNNKAYTVNGGERILESNSELVRTIEIDLENGYTRLFDAGRSRYGRIVELTIFVSYGCVVFILIGSQIVQAVPKSTKEKWARKFNRIITRSTNNSESNVAGTRVANKPDLRNVENKKAIGTEQVTFLVLAIACIIFLVAWAILIGWIPAL